MLNFQSRPNNDAKLQSTDNDEITAQYTVTEPAAN